MRKLHLMREDDDPWSAEAYCGVSLEDDSREWTMHRKELLKSPNRCSKCAKLSKPEKRKPFGSAAQELAKLEQLNRLRDGIKWTPTQKEAVFVSFLENAPTRISATYAALHLECKVSEAIEVLTALWHKGACCKIKHSWLLCDEANPPQFNIVRPE